MSISVYKKSYVLFQTLPIPTPLNNYERRDVTLGNDNGDNGTDGQTDRQTDGQTECDAICGPLL